MKISKINLGTNLRVNTRYDLGYICRISLLTIQVCFGPLVVGHIIGFSSPAIPDLKKWQIIKTHSHEALFASLMNVGGVAGSLAIGQILDKAGRKYALAISVLPALIGYLLMIGSSSVSTLLIGRVLTGLTCGLNTAATSVYFVEIAPTSMRGVLGSFNQLGITIGIFISYFAGVYMSYASLAIVGASLALAMIIFAMLPTLPESPRYLLQEQKVQAAAKVLAYLRPSHYDAQEELRDMTSTSELPTTSTGVGSDQSSINNNRTESVTISELFSQPEYSGPLFVALGLMSFQQLSGVNVIMFYAQGILSDTGAVKSPGLATCLVAGVQVLVTIAATVLMDKCGRRQFLQLASFIMLIAHFALGLFFLTHSTKGSIAVISLALFIVGFSIGWGPVPFLITAEIFPTRVRSTANGLAICSSWLFGFCITETFPTLQAVVGIGWLFIGYSGLCVIGLYFVWKYVPETRGKSLEDLELFFIGTRSSSRSL